MHRSCRAHGTCCNRSIANPGNEMRLMKAAGWMVACLLAIATPAHAQSQAQSRSLTPVTPGTLPTLPDAAPLVGIAVVDDVPLAVQADAAWRLDAQRRAWTRAAWTGASAGERVAAVF